ncbi:998_t:CDS:10, partial [Rhizophagus irregularis]
MIELLFYVSVIIVGYHILKRLLSRPSKLNDFERIPSMPTLKFMWAMIRKKPQDEIQEIISRVPHEGILKANAGTITFFYFQDVEYIKQFLTKSEDALPKMQHNLGNRVKSFYGNALSHDVIGENAFKLFNLMDYNLNIPINIYDMMQRTTIEILGQVAFAYKFGTPDIIKSYKYIMDQTENQLHILFPILDKLPLKSNRLYKEKMNEFDNFILNIIEKRKRDLFNLNYQNKIVKESENKDLLMSMLEMSEKEGIKIDSHELRDNLVNFFIAGHDTTSLNISVAIYHLAKYPEMQKKARDEVIRPNDYVQVGPYIIPPKSYNCVNVWHVHHDPKIWKNPNQWDPERFLNGEKRHPYSWIPFSGGPRNCAGQNFSLMEQRVLIAMILLKYEWTLPENSMHKEKFYLDSNFLLKPKDLS